MTDLSILIADDHTSVRRGIRALLESHAGWSVCGEVSNGREAVELTRQLKPDVVLLDVSMPELDGLQATRAIVGRDRHAQVIILTTHDSEVLAAEAALAGARGALSKIDADETLIAAIESLSRAFIHLAGSVVNRARHIAALFVSAGERYRVLGSFVAEGLSRGEKAVHIIDAADREMHRRSLRRSGVDLQRAEKTGAARIVPWEDAYLHGGQFDQVRMLETAQQILRDSLSEGFPRTRLIAHMEWAQPACPGASDLAAYESRLNEVLPSFDAVVVCSYDLTRFAGTVIADVIRSHPAILLGDVFHDNPFYVPSATMSAS
jgi:DNA-binding NarL/FixJ family response regulator